MTDRSRITPGARDLWPGLVGAALAAATLILYLVIIGTEGDSLTQPRVVAVATGMGAVAAALAAGTLIRRPAVRGGLLGAGTVGAIQLGLFGLFSVGFPLLLAGLFGVAALWDALSGPGRGTDRVAASISAVVAVVLILLAFSLTQ